MTEPNFELDLDELDQNIHKENKVETRIRDLSDKVKTTAEDRDIERKAREEAEAKIVNLEKEREFLNSFSDSTAKYPGAHEFKDAIKDKVMAGYTVEDATVSVLAKEGKLMSPEPTRESPLGGSANNQPDLGGTKTLKEMSRDDKRQALIEAESRGDITT